MARYVARREGPPPVDGASDYRNTVRRYLLAEFGATPCCTRSTPSASTPSASGCSPRAGCRGARSRRSSCCSTAILKRAKRKGWIATNPAEDAERVTVRRTATSTCSRPRRSTPSLAPTASELVGAIYVTAAFTGLRMGELRALRWADVDFAKRLVHVRRNFTARAFGRAEVAARAQRADERPGRAGARRAQPPRRTAPAPDDLVFSPGSTAVPRRHRAQALLRRARGAPASGACATKEDPIVFHDLRHTFGTLAVQAFALSDVKAMMGHADISTTMIYVHHVPQTMRRRASPRCFNATGRQSPSPRQCEPSCRWSCRNRRDVLPVRRLSVARSAATTSRRSARGAAREERCTTQNGACSPSVTTTAMGSPSR